ncbi:hypothetical protein M1N56_06275 [Dehalococcoidia bacterium]|nr:hypothetical protein [Dehalococcoidia bacterium]
MQKIICKSFIHILVIAWMVVVISCGDPSPEASEFVPPYTMTKEEKELVVQVVRQNIQANCHRNSWSYRYMYELDTQTFVQPTDKSIYVGLVDYERAGPPMLEKTWLVEIGTSKVTYVAKGYTDPVSGKKFTTRELYNRSCKRG